MRTAAGPPFRRTVELAVDAFHAGSFPVGALLERPDGSTLEGRNRAGETQAPTGRLRNTALAHAEMDVMAQLPFGEYDGDTLYTSLEPCLLCQAAATHTHIGAVRYLAPDAICQGLDQLPTINVHTGRRYPDIVGPETGLLSDFAAALPMATMLRSGDAPWAVGFYEAHSPGIHAAAVSMVEAYAWPVDGEPLDVSLARFAASRAAP